MNFKKLAIVSGALLGMLGVIAGAFGAHALKEVLSPEQLLSFQTGVRYQMYHSLLLLGLSFGSEHRLLRIAILAVLMGVILFSGSIYLLVLVSAPVGPVTPLGGVLLIAGWAFLLTWGVRHSSAK